MGLVFGVSAADAKAEGPGSGDTAVPGEPAPVTPRVAPAASGTPATPTLDANGATTTSLAVSWTAPTTTGPAISDYDLRYCPTAGSCYNATATGWTVFQPDTADSTATTTTITGLTTSTEYYVCVF